MLHELLCRDGNSPLCPRLCLIGRSRSHTGRLVPLSAATCAGESHSLLLQLIPPLHPTVLGTGCVVAERPLAMRDVVRLPLGAAVEVAVVGVAADCNAQVGQQGVHCQVCCLARKMALFASSSASHTHVLAARYA